MADKSPQLILTALSQAVGYADGVALFSSKTSPGLFPATAAGKQAAQRCLDEGYLRSLPPSYSTEPPAAGGRKSRPPAECFTLTEKGCSFLLQQVSPREVLEDLVRVLEKRQNEVTELVRCARQMQQSLDALKYSTTKVLQTLESVDGSATGTLSALFRAFRQEQPAQSQPAGANSAGPASPQNLASMEDCALEQTIWTLLARWQKSGASEDCPLPDLFRQAQTQLPLLTLGQFQDGLRRLADVGAIHLHPWTGPLYDLPEPPQAMLVGHSVGYYASLRAEAALEGVQAGAQAAT